MEEHRIERSDLEPILRSYRGSAAFAEALRRARGDQLLRTLGRYIQFNSVFGSGVANLSGEVGSRQDLFRDPAETAHLVADRSADVAAGIFMAAIDEFGGASSPRRNTHRALAQATLRAAGEFLGCPPGALDEAVSLNRATLDAIAGVRDGYGINQTLDARKLLRAIGFHVGSEVLADEEFCLLDGFLREAHPEMVGYLERTRITVGGDVCSAYVWIGAHTVVEAEHFAASLVSANQALQYYAGAGGPGAARESILRGVEEFAALQAEFMDGLLAD